jgi:hypothetical protein
MVPYSVLWEPLGFFFAEDFFVSLVFPRYFRRRGVLRVCWVDGYSSYEVLIWLVSSWLFLLSWNELCPFRVMGS